MNSQSPILISFGDAAAIAQTFMLQPKTFYSRCSRDFSKLKVAELHAIIRHFKTKYPHAQGLSTSGLKADLVLRLQTFCKSSCYINGSQSRQPSGSSTSSSFHRNQLIKPPESDRTHFTTTPSTLSQGPTAMDTFQHTLARAHHTMNSAPRGPSLQQHPIAALPNGIIGFPSSFSPASLSVASTVQFPSSHMNKKPKPNESDSDGLSALETHQLHQLVAMEFPRESALRALRSAGDVDGAMLLLVTELESMEEARKEDLIRVQSEQAIDQEVIAKRQSKEDTVMDVKGAPLMSNPMVDSVLLGCSKTSSPSHTAFKEVLSIVDDFGLNCGEETQELVCSVRRPCLRLLELEKNAIKWYSMPARLFLGSLTERLVAKLAPLLKCSHTEVMLKATQRIVVEEVEALEDALFSLPTHGSESRMPDALLPYLDAASAVAADEDDDIEVITSNTTSTPKR